ncbi:O-methyltransferase-domain-containing protein [Armillaria mellea]|nr:O-methyltransferase-domain-containing protein [Armillaria mellea]
MNNAMLNSAIPHNVEDRSVHYYSILEVQAAEFVTQSPILGSVSTWSVIRRTGYKGHSPGTIQPVHISLVSSPISNVGSTTSTTDTTRATRATSTAWTWWTTWTPRTPQFTLTQSSLHRWKDRNSVDTTDDMDTTVHTHTVHLQWLKDKKHHVDTMDDMGTTDKKNRVDLDTDTMVDHTVADDTGAEGDLPPPPLTGNDPTTSITPTCCGKTRLSTAAIQNSEANGLPPISVSPAQGQLLYLLAKSIGAKRILEVGTLGGYSTIHLARALPDDGKVITLELDEHHAKVCRDREHHLKQDWPLKLTSFSAPLLIRSRSWTRNRNSTLLFIDADKTNMLKYFTESKRLLRKGGGIFVDNVVRDGRTADPSDTSEFTAGVKQFIVAMKDDEEVEATTIGTVTGKGYDGFLYAVKK